VFKIKFFRETLVILFIVLISFGIIFGVSGYSSRLTASWHGVMHSAIIYQILNGNIPPNDPFIIDYPTNFYWLWHYLLAIICLVFKINPLVSGLFINSLSLAITLISIWLIVSAKVKKRILSFFGCFLFLYVINPFGYFSNIVIQLTNKLMLGVFPKIVTTSSAFFYPILSIFNVSLNAHGGNVLGKFLNFTGMAVGIALFAFVLALLFFTKIKNSVFRYVGVLISLLLAFFLYPQSAMAIYISIFSAIFLDVLEVLKKRSKIIIPTSSIILFTILLLSTTLSYPYLKSISSAYEISVGINNLNTILENIIAIGWTIFPTIWVHVYILYGYVRKGTHNDLVYFSICSLGLALVSIILNIPGPRHEYKFAYFYSIPTGILIFLFIHGYLNNNKNKYIKKYILVFIVFVCLLPISSNVSYYLSSSWAKENPYKYNKINIDLNCEVNDQSCRNFQKCICWIRENTPPDSYLMVELENTDQMETSMLTQRKLIVVTSEVGTALNAKHFDEVTEINESIVKKIKSGKFIENEILSIYNSGVDWPEKFYILIETENNQGIESSNLELVYENLNYNVYKLDIT
jgi:hypothetical protein